MFTIFMCAVLAPAVAHAAAFPWSLPEPTIFIAAIDAWSPAPTAAPLLSGFNLFKRQDSEGGNTCGFVSGLQGTYIHPIHLASRQTTLYINNTPQNPPSPAKTQPPSAPQTPTSVSTGAATPLPSPPAQSPRHASHLPLYPRPQRTQRPSSARPRTYQHATHTSSTTPPPP